MKKTVAVFTGVMVMVLLGACGTEQSAEVPADNSVNTVLEESGTAEKDENSLDNGETESISEPEKSEQAQSVEVMELADELQADYDNIHYDYYEFEDTEDKFHIDRMKAVSADQISLEDTLWNTYAVVIKDTGEVYRGNYLNPADTYESVYMEFYDDQTGFYSYVNYSTDFTYNAGEYGEIKIDLSDGPIYDVIPYKEDGGEAEYQWLYLDMYGYGFWLQPIN